MISKGKQNRATLASNPVYAYYSFVDLSLASNPVYAFSFVDLSVASNPVYAHSFVDLSWGAKGARHSFASNRAPKLLLRTYVALQHHIGNK